MTEGIHVVLRGGPKDGHTVYWTGGNQLRVAELPSAHLSVGPAREPARQGTYYEVGQEPTGYRRFEWRGWDKVGGKG